MNPHIYIYMILEVMIDVIVSQIVLHILSNNMISHIV